MATTTVVSADRSGNIGIDYGADNETWIVKSGVYVWGTLIGASSIYTNNTLKNNGHITGNSCGVDFVGESHVINKVNGIIEGLDFGIFFDATVTEASLINHGTIAAASWGVYFAVATDGNNFLNNTGTIIGVTNGVWIASIHDGGTIVNSGLIRSGPPSPGAAGIFIDTVDTETTIITNAATGVIKGPLAIFADKGHFALTNLGKLIGGISDTAGLSDTVINAGKILGAVHLGGGRDRFNGNGGVSGAVFGEAGNDRLIGGPNADKLHGGDDVDKLTGNAGPDRFFFDTAGALTSFDTITDFNHAQGDKIVLSATEFVGIGAPGPLALGHFRAHPNAVTPNQHILYNPTNGFLFYDQDGSGSTYTPIHFATLSTHPALASTDFVVIA